MIQNHRPVPFLPCGKIFEKWRFNSLFNHSEKNNLLNTHQSGFILTIHVFTNFCQSHDIYKSIDTNPSLEVRGIFLDMSKAFERVWDEDLLFKLKRFILSGKYYDLINSFLKYRHQRVVLDGQSGNNFKPIVFFSIHKLFT